MKPNDGTYQLQSWLSHFHTTGAFFCDFHTEQAPISQLGPFAKLFARVPLWSGKGYSNGEDVAIMQNWSNEPCLLKKYPPLGQGCSSRVDLATQL